MKHEFLDYKITLGLIVISVSIGTVLNFNIVSWLITIGMMMTISYFIVILQPVAKYLYLREQQMLENEL